MKKATPVGVVSLIAESISKVQDVANTFSDLAVFVGTVTAGILIHWLVTFPLVYLVTVRRNPLTLLVNTVRPASMGFAATNSAIAIREMLNICDTKLGVDKRVTHLAIPFNLTLNAQGNAIFLSAASLFIARYTGFDLSPDRILIVGILTLMSSMALPPVPSGSIVSIIIILSALNIPVYNVALLFAVEWYLDRILTALNPITHVGLTVMTNSICQKSLKEQDMRSTEMTSFESAAPSNASNSQQIYVP